MARFFSFNPIRLSGLTFSGLTAATDSGFDDNHDAVHHGITYRDVFWFQDLERAVGFGGADITVSGEVVTGGTLTGVWREAVRGAWTQVWALEDISVNAVSFYEAAMTLDRGDDFAAIAQALAGSDVFALSAGNDNMRGFAGNDLIKGNDGFDELFGDGGNDTLVGGAQSDRLTGNAGADVFDFNRSSDSGEGYRDTIMDFTPGLDRIDLSGIDARTTVAGNQSFTGFIRPNADFTRAGQLKFVDGVLSGNTDGDAAAEFAIVLTGVTALSVADVIL